MKLQYCSITGADNAVQADDLVTLSKKYPYAEWAILHLPAKAGTPRFPTLGWIDTFRTRASAQCHTAMHLCDGGFLDFIAGKPETFDIMQGFRRIQLNLKFGSVDGQYDIGQLVARVRENPQWQFILQYTADKSHLLPLFADVPNHAVLFDASAGQGISPGTWDAPIAGHFCGYAGGINPDNVQAHLEKISAVAKGTTTWIDMESGVRTNDVFDLGKVNRVLEIARAYA